MGLWPGNFTTQLNPPHLVAAFRQNAADFGFEKWRPSHETYLFSLSSAGAHGWGKIRYQNSFQCFGGCTYLRSVAQIVNLLHPVSALDLR